MKGRLRFTIIAALVLLILLARNIYYGTSTYGIGDEILLENLSVKILETRTDSVIVRRPIAVNEFPGGVYVGAGKGFEILEAFEGHKFFLVRVELRNRGEERLHLTGKEYKVLSTTDGEIFYPGVISREARNASEDDFKNHYYPQLITIRTLLSGQRVEGWLIFELPEATKPEKLIWYTEFQSRAPAFAVQLN